MVSDGWWWWFESNFSIHLWFRLLSPIYPPWLRHSLSFFVHHLIFSVAEDKHWTLVPAVMHDHVPVHRKESACYTQTLCQVWSSHGLFLFRGRYYKHSELLPHILIMRRFPEPQYFLAQYDKIGIYDPPERVLDKLYSNNFLPNIKIWVGSTRIWCLGPS